MMPAIAEVRSDGPLYPWLYLWLYLGTLVLHLAFVHYCFAGAFYVASAAVRGRLAQDRIALVVREWLPSAVSCAITAGIAPLLFVQILYPTSFYTANLLLFNRWMAMLPVLIVAIYAMYLVKTKRDPDAGPARRLVAAAAVLAAALLVYVAWAFVENHLVGLRPAAWADMYRDGAASLATSPAAWLRLAMWICAAFPVFACLTAWQLRLGAGGADDAVRAAASRRLSSLALGGLAAVVPAMAAYAAAAPEFRAAGAQSPVASTVAAAGFAVSFAAWWLIRGRGALAAPMLWLASAGSLLSMGAMAVVREEMRSNALAGTSAAMRAPAASGGMVAFAVFAVLGLGAIVWIVRSVTRALATAPRST